MRSLYLSFFFFSPLCHHCQPVPPNADWHNIDRSSVPPQSPCAFLSPLQLCLLFLFMSFCGLATSLSASLGWSPLLLLSSFPNLFIVSHRDGPQRHWTELSDLNKCLRLESGLSCGLGCQSGSRHVSQSVVMHVSMSLSQRLSPSSPFMFVSLSLWHLFLMDWETGKESPSFCLCSKKHWG